MKYLVFALLIITNVAFGQDNNYCKDSDEQCKDIAESHIEAIVQALLVWISTNSHYSIENILPPEVNFVTPQQITAEYYDDRPDLIPDGGIDDRIWALYNAGYSPQGAIYLRVDSTESGKSGANHSTDAQLNQMSTGSDNLVTVNSVTSGASLPFIASARTASTHGAKQQARQAELLENDPIMTERLLHELVHHVQYQSGEVQTYQCQAQGEKVAYKLGGRYFKQRYMDDPMPNRNFWAHVYSRC